MKAVVWTKYGPPEVLEYRDIETPAPKANEVLIKNHAATVTAGDCEARSMRFPLFIALPMRLYIGFSKPVRKTILGQEFAGEVAAVGPAVTQYQVGDAVFGTTDLLSGAYAEYLCMPEDPGSVGGLLAPKPKNLTFEEAASVPVGGLEAIHFLGKAGIQPGQKVLINGAGGSIGTMAVQLARSYGAQVTAVDSAEKLPMLTSIGAVQVIDYVREDFTRRGETYDVIFDIVGKSSFSGSLRSLKESGYYLIANPRPSTMIRGAWVSSRTSKKVVFDPANRKMEELRYLIELIEARKIKPVIDRRYPLEQVAEAHRYVDTGRKQGSVVITVG